MISHGGMPAAKEPRIAVEESVRVLLAEDHVELAETVAMGLRREGLAVDIALDGAQALERAAVTSYDVVVLDRDLPKVHGDEVCRSLVAGGGTARVLMLTAASSVEARVEGLGIGADDYLPKPFAFAELVARIRALGRRPDKALPPVLELGELKLDPASRLAARAGRRLWLTPREFAVLEQLLAAQGGLVSAEELLERAWDEAADPFTNTVKVTISRLRRKLGDPPVIETVAQAGYRIAAPRDAG
jgi:DNA-binding response OmpR family regulator